MSDKPTKPGTDPVSLDKPVTPAASAPKGASAPRGRLTRGKSTPAVTTAGDPMPPPPKYVRYAAFSLALSAAAALFAALSLLGLKGWLFHTARHNNPDPGKKGHKTTAELHDAVNSTIHSNLVATVILVLALLIAARAVLKGRYWSRWTVIGLWVLSTFTGTFAGFSYLVGITSSEPMAFKASTFIAAVAFVAGVGFVSLRPSADYFNLTRPARPEGAPARRGGLFGPRPPRQPLGSRGATGARGSTGTRGSSAARGKPAARGTSAASAADERARSSASPQRGRAKQRAASDSAAKGAELARARAKASKSRRSGV